MRLTTWSSFIVATYLAVVGCGDQDQATNTVKLYAMDCGTVDAADMTDLSDDGTYDGQAIHMSNPCFLLRHPRGDLLWDVGHPDDLVDDPDGLQGGVWTSKMTTKLVDQLARLDLEPADIEYLSLSHLHPDHSGNANLFAGSTFVVHEQEREYMFSEDIVALWGEVYSALEDAETQTFSEEYDVFGDGTAVVVGMPGHTPGSSVLLVRLERSGNFLLTGDLYVHARGRELQTIPRFTFDKEGLVASRQRFEALATAENARVVIQHNSADFESLPTFPAFLD